MCGDGANDCGALKAAHVGISLSEAEASVASPFTSQEANISCVLKVIKEGRAALVTSFGVFKFMVLYSITEFFSTVFLYQIDANLTDFQFLFIDVFLIVNLAFSFGHVEAYKGEIVPETPLSSMLSAIPILSLVLQTFTVIVAQLSSFYLVRQFPWFEPFKYEGEEDFTSYENFSIYSVSQFQYIIMAVVFSQGPPYRSRVFTNRLFFASVLTMTLVCLYLLFFPSGWVVDLMQFRYPPTKDFPATVAAIAAVQFLVCLFIEDFLLETVLFRRYKVGCNPMSKRYNLIKASLDGEGWPPVKQVTSDVVDEDTERRVTTRM